MIAHAQRCKGKMHTKGETEDTKEVETELPQMKNLVFEIKK